MIQVIVIKNMPQALIEYLPQAFVGCLLRTLNEYLHRHRSTPIRALIKDLS